MIKIYVRVLDNNPVFATHLIKITNTFNPADLPYQIDNNEIAIYTPKELNKITSLLKEKNIEFTIEELSWDQVTLDKVKDHKYNSRSELIKHIQEIDFEPEQSKLPRLLKENKELKQKLDEAENTIIGLVFGRDIDENWTKRKLAEGKISAAEIKLKMPGKAQAILGK